MSYEIDSISLQPFDEPWNMGVGFYVVNRDHNGLVTHLGAPIMMEPYKEASIIQHETFMLRRDRVQVLFDELYRMGFRPTRDLDGKADARGVVDAMKEHINDLRKMAFRK